MLRNLLRGGCDEQILERLGPDVFADAASDGQPSDSRPSDELSGESELEPLLEAELEPLGSHVELRADASELAATVLEASVEDSPAMAATQPVMAASPDPENSQERIARAFGDAVVSPKPLDEVVLDFLVANARKRKRPSS